MGALVSESDAKAHFQGTLKNLANNEVDIRGTWSDVWTNTACPGVTAVGTRTYTDSGITFSGNELNTVMVDKGLRNSNGDVILEVGCEKGAISGTLPYSELEPGGEFCGPVCTLDDLNDTFSNWEGKPVRLELSHVKGSEILTRTKTRFSKDGEGNTYVDYVVSTISYRQTDYALDMTGQWTYSQKAEQCPTAASSTLTYGEDTLNIEGEVITSISENAGGVTCLIEPINESYSYNEAPAQFCGPICSFADLNTAVTDSEGNTLSVFHAKDSDRFTVIKGDIIATATRNVDALAAD